MSSKVIDTNKEYKYGFTTDIESFKAPKGLSEETIKNLLKVEMKSKKISLMELTERTCKWPIGDPATDTFWFCGHDLNQANHIVKLIFLSLFNQ